MKTTFNEFVLESGKSVDDLLLDLQKDHNTVYNAIIKMNGRVMEETTLRLCVAKDNMEIDEHTVVILQGTHIFADFSKSEIEKHIGKLKDGRYRITLSKGVVAMLSPINTTVSEKYEGRGLHIPTRLKGVKIISPKEGVSPGEDFKSIMLGQPYIQFTAWLKLSNSNVNIVVHGNLEISNNNITIEDGRTKITFSTNDIYLHSRIGSTYLIELEHHVGTIKMIADDEHDN